MAILPVIVGFGGVNAAGRASNHRGYERLVYSALNQKSKAQVLQDLSTLTGIDSQLEQALLDATLVRKIDEGLFDAAHVEFNQLFTAKEGKQSAIQFTLEKKRLPKPIPENWQVSDIDEKRVSISIIGDQRFLLPSTRPMAIQTAGQLPSGFNPGSLYQSRNHPRGLQMTVYAASDALGSMGIDWETIRATVPADQVSVYAGSGMSQLDANANGGMMSARFRGKRVTSKQCPLGFAEMPADFINAYLLGSLGTTGTNMGACASYLYNLRQGIFDIQSGRSRIAIVGNSEAPVVPDVMEGYAAMGALATDKELCELDGVDTPNHRRACRPFAENKGFTLAESAQYVVLMDDSLAVEMGATIYGAVTDVFINADGFKKSISAPGLGNFITVAKAAASARALIGEKALRNNTFVQAHGTGTPQNRVTESDVLNRVAKEFGIESWPVAAIKSYLGHSIGVAAGDQIAASLGVWKHGVIPGITSIDEVASDVSNSNLSISPSHTEVGVEGISATIINAKGFGGNNASAVLVSPSVARDIIASKHGAADYARYQQANQVVLEKSADYDAESLKGEASPLYYFDHGVLGGDSLTFNGNDSSAKSVSVKGYGQRISLDYQSPYAAYLKK